MEIKNRSDFGEFLAERGTLGTAAEVGVAEGRYSLEICQWGVEHLYLVDLWAYVPNGPGDLGQSTEFHNANYRGCMDRIKDYSHMVTVLRGRTVTMAERIPDGYLDFLHLDAAHDKINVTADLEAYYPKLKPGGIASGHDYLAKQYGVKEAVDEFAAGLGIRVHAIDTDRPNDACFWFEKDS